MPQMQLPIFPAEAININGDLAFMCKEGTATYFNGHLPVFCHDENDIATFRMIISQFYINGNATQAELVRAFGIPQITLKRAVKLYRTKGPGAFYEKPKRGGARILKPLVLKKIQELLDQGQTTTEISEKLNLKRATIDKAIYDGRLKKKVNVTIRKIQKRT